MSTNFNGIAFRSTQADVLPAIESFFAGLGHEVERVDPDALRFRETKDYEFKLLQEGPWTILAGTSAGLIPALVVDVSRTLGVRAVAFDEASNSCLEHAAVVERGEVVARASSIPERMAVGIDYLDLVERARATGQVRFQADKHRDPTRRARAWEEAARDPSDVPRLLPLAELGFSLWGKVLDALGEDHDSFIVAADLSAHRLWQVSDDHDALWKAATKKKKTKKKAATKKVAAKKKVPPRRSR